MVDLYNQRLILCQSCNLGSGFVIMEQNKDGERCLIMGANRGLSICVIDLLLLFYFLNFIFLEE